MRLSVWNIDVEKETFIITILPKTAGWLFLHIIE